VPVGAAAAGDGSCLELATAPAAGAAGACSFPLEEGAAEAGAAEDTVAGDGAGTAAEGFGCNGFGAGLLFASSAAMLPGLVGERSRFAANTADASTAAKKISPNMLFRVLTRILRCCAVPPQGNANLAPNGLVKVDV
jgi:hypothetical protein